MRRALFLAERGVGSTTPNPAVGACVVTADGVPIGQGTHMRAGGPHAEVRALDAAGAGARGATLYCTLEPCCHTGRTGPCTERIVAAGVARVVAAMQDPDPRVSGRGFARLRDAGLEVIEGVERDAAVRLNLPFLSVTRKHRPFVILKAATSVDGYLAARADRRTFLTSVQAERLAHRVRARVDAIAVGSGTVLADDPLLTCRHVYRERRLTRVVFDRRLRTPATARLFSTLSAGPVIILTSQEAVADDDQRARRLESAGATVVPTTPAAFEPMLRRLVAHDVQSVLLEGGAALHAAAWDAGVVDSVNLYVAPHAIGPGGVPFLEGRRLSTASLYDRRVEPRGADVVIEGYVHRVD
jgi:diaminohydroxyphosphoribosylaminopyrimidine deaminase/5-amino-6-(5-phosphoribosylamino)uracil reductase